MSYMLVNAPPGSALSQSEASPQKCSGRIKQTGPGVLTRCAASASSHQAHVAFYTSNRWSTRLQARRRVTEDEEYVELDDEVGWSEGDGGFQAVLKQVWTTASRAVDRLVDVAEDYAPDGVSRGTVNLAVRAALVLLLIGFARSLLGVVLTVGTIVFGLYVATRILRVDVGGGGGGGSSKGRGKGRRRGDTPRTERGGLPSGRAEDGGLLDVWFERSSDRGRPDARGEADRARRQRW